MLMDFSTKPERMKVHTKYKLKQISVNDDFFSDLSLQNCYWAGFIAAVGYIKKGNILKLKLSSRDIQHLEEFSKDIGFMGKIHTNEFITKNGNLSISSEISIKSEKICEDLKNNFNIGVRKTKTYIPPILEDDLLDAFIVGYIDGDGCIGYYGRGKKQKYLNLIVVGTIQLCEVFRRRFETLLGEDVSILDEKQTPHLHRIQVSGNKAEKLYNHFKNIKCPHLKRKWDYYTKNWGYERWIVNNEKYCGKLLYFNKGKRCSWHKHAIKHETFYLQSGKMILKYSFDDDLENANTRELIPGDTFEISVGLTHQMIAIENSELFEFSTQHFDSDSIRIQKGD